MSICVRTIATLELPFYLTHKPFGSFKEVQTLIQTNPLLLHSETNAHRGSQRITCHKYYHEDTELRLQPSVPPNPLFLLSQKKNNYGISNFESRVDHVK